MLRRRTHHPTLPGTVPIDPVDDPTIPPDGEIDRLFPLDVPVQVTPNLTITALTEMPSPLTGPTCSCCEDDDLDLGSDPDLASYYRDLTEVNQTIHDSR